MKKLIPRALSAIFGIVLVYLLKDPLIAIVIAVPVILVIQFLADKVIFKDKQ